MFPIASHLVSQLVCLLVSLCGVWRVVSGLHSSLNSVIVIKWSHVFLESTHCFGSTVALLLSDTKRARLEKKVGLFCLVKLQIYPP